jgi:hypothetical protein
MSSVNHEFSPVPYADNTIPKSKSKSSMRGGSRVGFKELSTSSQITGKSAGHPEHHSYVPSAQPRDLHHEFKSPFQHTGGKQRRMKSKKQKHHTASRKRRHTRRVKKGGRSHYQTQKGGDRIKELWNELVRLRSKDKHGGRRHSLQRRRRMRGGSVRGENTLPMNNEPLTWGYGLNTRIPNEMSALANPMPIERYVKGEPVARS